MAEKRSSGKLGIVLLSVVTGAASYFVIGIQDIFGYLLLGMIGFIFLLGMIGKINPNAAKFGLLALLILGVGSPYIAQFGTPTYAFGAKAIAMIIFVFVTISAIGTILKFLMGLAGIAILLIGIVYVMKSKELRNDDLTSEELVYQEEQSINHDDDLKSDERPDDVLRSHTRGWRDFDFNSYETTLEVWEADYHQSHNHRKTLKRPRAQSSRAYWSQIYQNLINFDVYKLDRVLQNFMAIGKDKQLNSLEFAKMVVSCVQHIPYVLIYSDPCENLKNESPSLQEMAQQHACKGPVKFGLQSPTEFMYDLKGDCDTRTVFLFTILSRLGYKVCILNSEVYGHSMFGIVLPTAGKYKSYQGEQYYFWETTAKGWDIGVLPPEMGQVNHWEVVLAN